MEVTGRRKSWKKTIFFIGILVLLVATFTVLGVSRVMELGSAGFFIVVTAGVLVLLCFFCGLIAYARAKLLSVQTAADPNAGHGTDGREMPVFYFLQTIHREVPLDPVPDEEYWMKSGGAEVVDQELKISPDEHCPVCLCEMDPNQTATGVSACCKRLIHVKCAQDYFNSIRHVRCVFCRKDVEEAANTTLNTTCPSPPVLEHSNV
jgi:hypothetical protein